jgi:hypothetical protein
MSEKMWRKAEKWVAEITGGIVIEHGRRRRGPRVLRGLNGDDVLSGNRTELQVKWSRPVDVCTTGYTQQWHWNLRNNLSGEGFQRMILIGGAAPHTVEGCQIFDVPSEWIAAWYKADIYCGVGYNRWGEFGYQLYSWFVSNSQQLADRYGPGKVPPVETLTGEQQETLPRYKNNKPARVLRSLPP